MTSVAAFLYMLVVSMTVVDAGDSCGKYIMYAKYLCNKNTKWNLLHYIWPSFDLIWFSKQVELTPMSTIMGHNFDWKACN